MSLPLEGAWTFDPSYPIFLANAVRYLGGSGRDRKDLLVRTGGLAELRFPATAAGATGDPPHARARAHASLDGNAGAGNLNGAGGNDLPLGGMGNGTLRGTQGANNAPPGGAAIAYDEAQTYTICRDLG